VNFKLSKIALALTISFLALDAVATTSVDDIPTIKLSQAEKNARLKANNQQFNNRYFVLLEDEPVALYQGKNKNFKATNLAASRGLNATSKGKLNLQSSASISYRNFLAQQQNKVISTINSALKRNVQVHEKFKIALNGLVMNLEANEVLALRKLPGVLAVEKEEMRQLLTDVGPQHVGAPAIWDNTDIQSSQGEGLIVGVLDTGIASYTSQVYSYQGAAGFEGKAFHPAFADVGADGYDHTNPNGAGVYLGDCIDSPFWCNDKVIGVVSYDGMKATGLWDMRAETGQDDHGHGTHVASTIAGNRIDSVSYPTVFPDMEQNWKHKYYNSDIKVPVSGVAPHANIVAYKVCSVQGCATSAAVAAIEHAIANNIDVINYSVGGAAESPWYSSDSLAFLSAREAGIFVAVAAGNSGGSGEKTIGSPGNSPWVTSVAALSHSRDFTEEKTASFSGGETTLEDLIGQGATSGILTPTDVVYAGNIEDSTEAENAGSIGVCGDYSLPNSWDAGSIEGKIVICRRGGSDSDGAPLTRLSKGDVALKAKAAGMIFINATDELDNIANDLHVLPTIHLNKADGDKLLEWLSQGDGHQVIFTGSELTLNEEKADITADFTSRGPDYFSNDYLVPDVGAPGVEILAAGLGDNMQSSLLQAYERINGDFRFMSGTSMASPHIAGMYLLMKAAHPEWTAAEAQSALMMTAFTDVKENDDFDGVMTRADMHRTGSGSARVNLAINAGLVMNETRAGYEAANPYAEQFGLSDNIEGWHGQPHQMNLPSLSKGECLLSCDWTRTFKGTKTGSWTVSFEHYNEGFTLSADKSEFTVSEGEEVTINFTATALQGLGVKWTNGRVIITPADSSTPVQSIPVAVNFIAGEAPELAGINVKRTNDSAPVNNIITIGSDDLTVTKSGLAKADIHQFDLMRDATSEQIFLWSDERGENQTIRAIPLNIQADTKRLVIDVLETSSPDIDIYVGIDSDLDGLPSALEMQLMPYMSANETSEELIDVISPSPDTYWVLIHNFANGPAPLTQNQMVCEDGQEADESMTCADAPIMDSVKLAITSVTYDEDNMMIEVPTSVEPLEEVTTRIAWDQAMSEGDIYHGVFWLGTSVELDKNIGAVRVNMLRGTNDVLISEPTLVNDKMSLTIELSANSTSESREYSFSMELAEAVTIDMFVKEVSISGVSMQMSASEESVVDYTVNDNLVSWTQTQQPGASKISFSIMLDTSDVNGTVDATPLIESMVNTSEEAEYSSPNVPVFIEGRPVFSASASLSTVKEGEPVTLSATVVDSVIENPALSYQWTQTSGPTASIMGTGQSVTFTAPEVSSDQTLTFSLVGSNGSKASAAESVSVNVESKSSGGSTNLALLMLTSLSLLLRRRKNKL